MGMLQIHFSTRIKKTSIIKAQTIKGTVSAISSQTTARVTVNRLLQHPLYRKLTKVTKNYLADVQGGEFKIGEQVELLPCKPISKRKRFLVKHVIKKINK